MYYTFFSKVFCGWIGLIRYHYQVLIASQASWHFQWRWSHCKEKNWIISIPGGSIFGQM